MSHDNRHVRLRAQGRAARITLDGPCAMPGVA